jgi:hypothetical protein
MTPAQLLTLFRTEVFDAVAPYLWADAWFYGALDAAQKQFCRDTYGIEDASSFTLDISVSTEWYDIDPKILKLRSAINPATGSDVPFIALEKMVNDGLRFDGTRGPIKALITGMNRGQLRACPIPSVSSVVELRTFRLPETIEAAADDIEIDDQHHRYLLYWVKHLAYDIQDTETYDKAASDKYKGKHDAYCAKALLEQNRLRRPVSTVTYGGI